MDSAFEPVPQESGALGPPRRVPPTAVGTMELPPRPPRRPAYPSGPSRVRRVALRLLAVLLASTGIAALWPPGWRAALGAAALTLAVHVAHRAGSERHARGKARPITDTGRGESVVRSA
jgi:hypothetical protein